MKRVLILREEATSPRYWSAAERELRDSGWEAVTAFTRGAFGEEPGPQLGLGVRNARDLGRARARLHELIREVEPRIIHASEPIQGALAARADGATPLVFHRHHMQTGIKQNLLARIATEGADSVIAVSRSVAERVRRGRASVHWVHNGTDPIRWTPEQVAQLRSSYGIAEDRPTALVVGRLCQEKGQRDLLEAWGSVRDGVPHALLVLVGDGPDRSRIGPDRQDVLSVGHQDDVAPWFGLADLVVIPSRREGFGLTAIEAMSAGKAIVATRVGGLTEIIEEGVSGILVEPGDQARLSTEIADLLADPARAKALGEKGERRYRESFTVANMVRGWVQVYEKTLDAR